MGIAESVLAKMQETPSFRPAEIQTFGDWSIEAGDIIGVETGEGSRNIPVFTSQMNWNGSAETLLSASGNRKREMMTKQDRKLYSGLGGFAGFIDDRLKELEEGLEFDAVELMARLTNAEAGLQAVTERRQRYVNGVPQFLKDANGNIVYYKNEDGSLKLDENGDPIPVPDYEYEVSESRIVAALTTTDANGNVIPTEAALVLQSYKDPQGNIVSLSGISSKVNGIEAGQVNFVNKSTLDDYAKKSYVEELLGQIDGFDATLVESATYNYLTHKDENGVTVLDSLIGQFDLGNNLTLAIIKADLVDIHGKTDILGRLSVKGGKVFADRGFSTESLVDCGSLSVYGNSISMGFNSLTIQADVAISGNAFRIGTNIYKDEDITSTDGQKHYALGYKQ